PMIVTTPLPVAAPADVFQLAGKEAAKVSVRNDGDVRVFARQVVEPVGGLHRAGEIFGFLFATASDTVTPTRDQRPLPKLAWHSPPNPFRDRRRRLAKQG